MTVWREIPKRRPRADRSTADENTAQSTTLAGHANGDPGETTRASSPPSSLKGREPAGFFIDGIAASLGPASAPPTQPTTRLSAVRVARLRRAFWPESVTSTAVQLLLAHNVPRGDGLESEDLLRRARQAEGAGHAMLAGALAVRAVDRFQQEQAA